jgi:hypothetical protein
MGEYAGGDGEYTINNYSELVVNGNMEIGSNSADGKALFTQKDTSIVTVTDTVWVGSPFTTITTGTYDMQGGTLIADRIQVNQGGQFINSGGWVEAAESVNYGVMTGTGAFMGTVVNYGAISPGESPGTLTIDGNLIMESTSTLFMELGGLDQGTSYDLLEVTGEAWLAGILNVDLWDSFIPAVGDSFDILTAWIIQENNLSLGDTPDGWIWDLAYLDLDKDGNLDTVRLTANAVPIPGAVWLFAPALLGLVGLRRKLEK